MLPGIGDNWRESLQIFKGFPCIHVLIDTSLSITKDLLPPPRDPSGRLIKCLKNVFNPLYLMPTIRLPSEIVIATRMMVKVGESKCDFSDLLKTGRPLISALVMNDGVMKAIPRLGVKLTGGYFKMGNPDSILAEKEIIFAIAGCRFPLSFTARMNEALVAKHMAVLTFLSVGQELINASYAPEPLLQEAACQIMWQASIYDRIVEYLSGHIISGTVGILTSKGEKSEICTVIFLQYVYDRAVIVEQKRLQLENTEVYEEIIELEELHLKPRKGRRGSRDLRKPSLLFSFPVKVSTYLSLLLGEEKLNIVSDTLKDCYVSFTKTMKFAIVPCKALLFAAWRQRCAIICPRNLFAVDIIIPISKKLNPEYSSDFIPLYIQVKSSNTKLGSNFEEEINTIESLYEEVFRLNSHFEDLPPEGQQSEEYEPPSELGLFSENPFIIILVQAGDGGAVEEVIQTKDDQPMYIIPSISESKVLKYEGSTLGHDLKMIADHDSMMKVIEHSHFASIESDKSLKSYKETLEKIVNLYTPIELGNIPLKSPRQSSAPSNK